MGGMKIKLDTYRDLTFPGLSRRRVDVWLPEGFDSPRPVLYMHDGQNLFRSTRLIGSGWRVAETVSALATQGLIDPPIVVGITSTPNRLGDYMPQKPMQSADGLAFINSQMTLQKMKPEQFKADDYLRFMVEVVKPFIDEHYQSKPDARNTALMGSSMGGLISLYALCEYPKFLAWPAASQPIGRSPGSISWITWMSTFRHRAITRFTLTTAIRDWTKPTLPGRPGWTRCSVIRVSQKARISRPGPSRATATTRTIGRIACTSRLRTFLVLIDR